MTVAQIIGLIIVVALGALGGFFIVKKSKKHDLAKWITLFILVAIALTWIFGFGYYNGAEYVEYSMYQQGLTDIPNLFYYAINFAGDKIIFLLALGAFYAVISKCSGYKKLVVTIADKLKGKEIITALSASLLFAGLASVLSQSFVTLLFVPFVVSIILSMKLDKITAFCVTFGSILIGTLGATYGSEGLSWFNYYTQTALTVGILYRLIVLAVAFILFNFFTVLHIKKVLAGKKVNEVSADPFKVEKTDKTAKVWPIITILSIVFVFVILGYMNWNGNFGIECFDKFHEWLIGLKIGGFAVFAKILGNLNAAFGAWNLFHISILLGILSIVLALVSKISLNDFIESYSDGFKKLGKGILLYIAAYMLMIVVYDVNTGTSLMSTLSNTLSVKTFNPYLTSLTALISNIFHVDFGFTGYSVASAIMAGYATNVEVIHTIFATMYGFVGLCIPTSGMLLIGLSYLDIEYKTWIKYIGMFVLAILVILLVLFTVMTYI